MAVATATLLLPGCTGSPAPDQPSGQPTSSPAPQIPDLSQGIPIPGHGTYPVTDLHIVDSTGYRAYGTDRVAQPDDRLERIDLTTGRQIWQAPVGGNGMPTGDALPTVWVGPDGSILHALRSAYADDGPDWATLLQDDFQADTGELTTVTVLDSPTWQLPADGLPPLVLDDNGTSLVLAADPEVGAGTAVMELPNHQIAWQNDLQAYTATEESVLVRTVSKAKFLGMAALDRGTGQPLWELTDDATDYTYLGRTDAAFLIDAAGVGGHRVVWIDTASGEERATTDPVAIPDELLDCQIAATVIACNEGGLGQTMSGYDLTSGEQLWSITHGDGQFVPRLATSYRDWLYAALPGAEPDGVVLDARTGADLARGIVIPDIQFSNDSGVLVATPTGQSWVPSTGG